MTFPLYFLMALIAVESGGNTRAVGDQGRSLGCLQIRREVVHDVNRIARTKFTHADARNAEKSLIMCRIYLQHYCTAARLQREPTLEDAARIWNGGPNGWKSHATDDYWSKVRHHLLAHENPDSVHPRPRRL